MPTIAQLPTATTVNPQDEVLLSQGGVATGATVGLLLAGTQPAVTTATGTLLGRVSLGPGGPEPVAVGTGLALATGTLAANGTDHASFPAQLSLLPTDEAVVNSAGVPRRLALSLLRGLFSAGSNVAIDQNGVISAGSNLGTGSGGASLPFRAVTGTTDTPTAADRNGFIAYSAAPESPSPSTTSARVHPIRCSNRARGRSRSSPAPASRLFPTRRSRASSRPAQEPR